MKKCSNPGLFFVDKLIGMGARIVLCDPHRAVVTGPSRLTGLELTSPDVRAGMAMVIAALAAEGKALSGMCIRLSGVTKTWWNDSLPWGPTSDEVTSVSLCNRFP